MAINGKKISELDQDSIDAFNSILNVPPVFTKITWFGTSVPATGYPQTACGYIGATCYNKAIGGSFIFAGPNEGPTQYGFASDTLLDTIPDEMKQYTFRNILDNGSSSLWDSDLFVFDHGHNDHGRMDSYKVDGVLTLTEGNAFDRAWMVGGLNHVIAEILQVNPLARFAIINDYRYESFDNKDANQLVADYWGIPILNWELGLRNFNPNSQLDYTVLKYYTGAGGGDADYIHPTATLRALMARKIASWFRTIV